MLIETELIGYRKYNGAIKNGYVSVVALNEKDLSINEYNKRYFSQREANYADILRSKRSKHNYFWGRIAAKYAVINYYANCWQQSILHNTIEIGSDIDGKPIIYVDGKSTSLLLTVTHTEGAVIALVGGEEFIFGIDCELNKRDRSQTQIIEWTQKEALGKYLGIGLCARNDVFMKSIVSKERELHEVIYSNFIDIHAYTCCLKRYTISLAFHNRIEKEGLATLLKKILHYVETAK